MSGHPREPTCRAPIVSMEFGPDGSVMVCCANHLYPIGLVGTQPLREMWTGPAAQNLRSAVARGDLSLGCNICSHRLRHGGAELPMRAYDAIEPTDAGAWPTNLSFSLHNTCNLECVMCGGDRSSRIRTRRHGLPSLPHVYGPTFFSEIEEFIGHARWCDFVGGEPLLIREHWEVWDIMRSVAPGIGCSITTNGTVWNARVESLLEDFPTAVRISMDGVTASTFERIRVGSDFGTFLENFGRFLAYARRNGTDLSIAWSFVQQNWFELADAVLWAEESGVSLYVTTVLEREYGVQHLPTDRLVDVHERMTRQSDRILARLVINREVWLRQLAMVESELRERAGDRVSDPCFDPPAADSARSIAERVVAHSRTPGQRPTPTALADHAEALGADLGAAERVGCDRHGMVIAHDPGPHGVLVGVTPGTTTMTSVLQQLGGRFGAMWYVEEQQLIDAVVHVLGFGPLERNGDELMIIRLFVTPSPDGLEVAMLRARRSDHLVRHRATSVEIGRRSR